MVPCHDSATCLNLIGKNGCDCRPGFTGDGLHCHDVDECLDQMHHCHANAACTNTIGSYVCDCIKGYRDALRNGHLCRDENECRTSIRDEMTNCDVPERAKCSNTEGSYNCRCIEGFIDQGSARINECLGELPGCPCIFCCSLLALSS